jgi:L-2,4-diaminobutyrate transaminase
MTESEVDEMIGITAAAIGQVTDELVRDGVSF